MRSVVKKYIDQGTRWFNSYSLRERVIISVALSMFALLGLKAYVYEPSKDLFSEQSQKIQKIQEDYKVIPAYLEQYHRFSAKRKEIEDEFQQVEIKEGEQSLLENILSGKVDAGFDITPGTPRAFGGNYEQMGFSVRFTTGNLQSLVDVLTEISTGKKRMIITSVGISKDPNGEKLRVDLGVSSIRQASPSQPS